MQVRFENYNLGSAYVNLTLAPNFVSFVTNQGSDGKVVYDFEKSQIWQYDGYSGQNLIVQYSGIPWNRCSAFLFITRRSKGLILRLAMPVMLMLLLVSLTYWADLDGRVDATVNLLLAISALYIVIFQYVPMIGNLTQFDKYMLAMYMMTTGAVFSHQVSYLICEP